MTLFLFIVACVDVDLKKENCVGQSHAPLMQTLKTIDIYPLHEIVQHDSFGSENRQ